MDKDVWLERNSDRINPGTIYWDNERHGAGVSVNGLLVRLAYPRFGGEYVVAVNPTTESDRQRRKRAARGDFGIVGSTRDDEKNLVRVPIGEGLTVVFRGFLFG